MMARVRSAATKIKEEHITSVSFQSRRVVRASYSALTFVLIFAVKLNEYRVGGQLCISGSGRGRTDGALRRSPSLAPLADARRQSAGCGRGLLFLKCLCERLEVNTSFRGDVMFTADDVKE